MGRLLPLPQHGAQRADARDDVGPVVGQLTAQLPVLPSPWDVDELVRRLEQRRGRPLRVHSFSLPALPFGLWYDDGECDHIIHRVGVDGYHRDHVILHEICHMLAWDTVLTGDTVFARGTRAEPSARPGGNGDPAAVLRGADQAVDGRYGAAEEELAETFASRVLSMAWEMPRTPVSDFERRAAAMFGAG